MPGGGHVSVGHGEGFSEGVAPEPAQCQGKSWYFQSSRESQECLELGVTKLSGLKGYTDRKGLDQAGPVGHFTESGFYFENRGTPYH